VDGYLQAGGNVGNTTRKKQLPNNSTPESNGTKALTSEQRKDNRYQKDKQKREIERINKKNAQSDKDYAAAQSFDRANRSRQLGRYEINNTSYNGPSLKFYLGAFVELNAGIWILSYTSRYQIVHTWEVNNETGSIDAKGFSRDGYTAGGTGSVGASMKFGLTGGVVGTISLEDINKYIVK
jgi:hypothetical protein